MVNVLAEYLEINSKYPLDISLSKAQKKIRHNELIEWMQREHESIPRIVEIDKFVRENNALKYEQPFFDKVVFPRIQMDIDADEIDSIKFLFDFNYANNRRIGSWQDCVFMFCLSTDFLYTPLSLSDIILGNDPTNEIVLKYKYEVLKRQLKDSLHEIPSGVLDGKNAAQKDDMRSITDVLVTFSDLSRKLGNDDSALIQRCASIYDAWSAYLDHLDDHKHFREYLIKHSIQY